MTLRKKRTLTMSAILCVLLALTFVPSSYATTYTITAPVGGGCSDAGGTWDPASMTCTLGDDLTGDNIVIDGDGIILDCDWHSITTGTGAGIEAELHSGITIKSCFVREYDTGISLRACSNSTVVRNSVVGNSGSGISISFGPGDECKYNTVENNTAVDNNFGIRIDECEHITITGNHSNWNLIAGIYLSDVRYSMVKGNNANANGSEAGIASAGGSQNTLKSNTTNSNAYDGINLMNCASFTLTGNTSNGNLTSGISLSEVDNSILTSNETNSNGSRGTYLEIGCEGNTLRGNTANANGYVNAPGYGFVGIRGPIEEPPNNWLGNFCKNNSGGGSIYGSDIGGELCKPQY